MRGEDQTMKHAFHSRTVVMTLFGVGFGYRF